MRQISIQASESIQTQKSITTSKAYGGQDRFEALMEESLKAERGNIGVCSLCENPLVSRMWERYGDHHRGVCFGFDDRDGNGAQADKEEFHFLRALRVIYSDDRPEVSIYGPDKGWKKVEKTLLTKTKNWEFEREWRLIDQFVPGLKRFPKTALRSVIFGKECREQDRSEIVEIIRECQFQAAIFEVHDERGELELREFRA